MKIIPAIDIIEGKCVRLTQGDYSQKRVYRDEPVEVAKEFEAAGLQYLHLVDLDGARTGAVTNWDAVESICKRTSLQVDFGGGVKTSESIQRLFDLGVSQVNLGSIAVKRPELVFRWLDQFSPDRIILSADVHDEQVAINGWQEKSATSVYDFIEKFMAQGLTYVTCTDINQDGMLTGPSIPLYLSILDRFPSVKLIASGGVGSLSDVEALRTTGVYGTIIGKAIYEGRIELNQLTS